MQYTFKLLKESISETLTTTVNCTYGILNRPSCKIKSVVAWVKSLGGSS